MKYYLAKVVYRIVCGNGNHTAQFDEQLRLIIALNEEAALQKAIAIGRQEEEVFLNAKEQLVQWKFIDVAELHLLDNLLDGAELYSQVKEADDPDAYGRFLKHKGNLLREKHRLQTTQLA